MRIPTYLSWLNAEVDTGWYAWEKTNCKWWFLQRDKDLRAQQDDHEKNRSARSPTLATEVTPVITIALPTVTGGIALEFFWGFTYLTRLQGKRLQVWMNIFLDWILPAEHMLRTLLQLIPPTQSCKSKFCWNKGPSESKTYTTHMSSFKSKNVAQIWFFFN